jgi:hypothetical protein
MSTALLVLLVAVLIASAVVAVFAFQAKNRRAQVMTRAGVGGAAAAKIPLIAKPDGAGSMSARVGAIAERFLPEGATSLDSNKALLQAGFESDSAPSIYALLRLFFALAVPGAMFAWGPHDTSTMMLLSGMTGIALGIIGPPAMLTRLGRLRQEKILRTITY